MREINFLIEVLFGTQAWHTFNQNIVLKFDKTSNERVFDVLLKLAMLSWERSFRLIILGYW